MQQYSSLPSSKESFSGKKPPLAFSIFRLMVPIIIFFVSIWLIFSKFQKTPAEKIEQSLHTKNYELTEKLISKYLKKDKVSRVRLLMYGSILQFALEEKGNLLETPNYQKMLEQEDSTSIFLKESYLNKIEMFPSSKRFLQVVCDLVEDFPSIYLTKETQEFLKTGFDSTTHWNQVNNRCLTLIFDDNIPFFKERLRLVSAEDVNFRSRPDTSSSVLAKLSTGEKVLLRQKGSRFASGNQNGNWQFLFLKDQTQGWMFDGYLVEIP